MFCKIVVHFVFSFEHDKKAAQVATGSGKKVWKIKKFPGQGKGMGYLFSVPIAILIEVELLSTHNICFG